MDTQPTYLSYMLRLWRAGIEQPAWRASLENPHTGELKSFTDIESVFSFLRQQVGASPDRYGGAEDILKKE
jgi:hypothetical protein